MNGTHTVEQFPGFCLVRDPHGAEVCQTPNGVEYARDLARRLDAVDPLTRALCALMDAEGGEPDRDDDTGTSAHAWSLARAALRILNPDE